MIRTMRIVGLIAFLASAAAFAQPLPGTRALEFAGDPAAAMVEGIHAYLDRATEASRSGRKPDRERLRTIIGAVDRRLPVAALTLDATTSAVRRFR